VNTLTEEVLFTEFEKFDFRIGKIIEAIQVSDSKKLIKFSPTSAMKSAKQLQVYLSFISPKS